MKNFKFYHIEYKNKKIIIGYCNYKKFGWYCSKLKGTITLFINNNYSPERKRKILHKVIREVT